MVRFLMASPWDPLLERKLLRSSTVTVRDFTFSRPHFEEAHIVPGGLGRGRLVIRGTNMASVSSASSPDTVRSLMERSGP